MIGDVIWEMRAGLLAWIWRSADSMLCFAVLMSQLSRCHVSAPCHRVLETVNRVMSGVALGASYCYCRMSKISHQQIRDPFLVVVVVF